jgi:hypothetical protein
MRHKGPWIFIIFAIALCGRGAQAEESLYDSFQRSLKKEPPRYLAQSESEDAYDPFADYSEFDDSGEEEADINFFRHGRFLTIGFVGGIRGFTDNLAQLYTSGPSYGFFICFFFDMRLAVQLGLLTGDHGFEAVGPSTRVTGNASINLTNIELKYYFNTQNVTRGLADLNPYLIGGVNTISRTVSLAGSEAAGQDSTMGLAFGGGIEIPTMRKKGFVGIQAAYRYVTFGDEGKPLRISLVPEEYASLNPSGDTLDILLILGLNY